MRLSRYRRIGGLLLACVLAGTLAGCGVFGGPSARDIAADFLTAFAEGDTRAAANLTDSAEFAKQTMDSVRDTLDPEKVTTRIQRVDANPGADRGRVQFAISWNLGDGRVWNYESTINLFTPQQAGSGDWRVLWNPSTVHPRLGEQQRILVRDDPPEIAPVLDREGRVLIGPETVVSVLLDRRKTNDLRGTATGLAEALNPLDAQITTRGILDGAREATSEYLVATLREADYQRVKPRIYNLSGLRFSTQSKLLPATSDLGPQILGGLQDELADELTGSPGWRVVIVDDTGTEIDQLHAAEGNPAQAVHSTLGLPEQQAAEAALGKLDEPAALVAIQPSTGDIVAVAQNEPANKQGAIALTGRYPPGSTFKIITAAAALQSGDYTANSQVDCPSTTVIDNRRIPNNDLFDLGTVPLHTALAKSCNTTFAQVSADLTADALTRTGKQFGIGVDYVLRGATTVTGSAPAAEKVVERAENGFGQGTILTSPFGMALTAATVAEGERPIPKLLADEKTEVDSPAQPVPTKTVTALREMMREVVTVGTAGELSDVPRVRGKTGTAQFGDGSQSHGWFAGYQDDLAFAVLVVGGGTALPAVKTSGDFLRGLR
ncbi:cell division protein FtsI/penicillin-binding protein 2 [Tamaricihabitans halophyticus]|uniref:Cell division protein FtsI/penicillin-binding protein 2 n=1 Tax=Tamaricihabitans halophyticus TaxID=1262583 RepID=A0A4R2QKB5_9PSEU|nr:penicillin-binding transpeptidase domain-containing protein [Tamaricihabitans halophyticus]TCP49184.1 cell division protein FtsI/penicillin-binding protein 2 [Tamaricihabitans halophyticus]